MFAGAAAEHDGEDLRCGPGQTIALPRSRGGAHAAHFPGRAGGIDPADDHARRPFDAAEGDEDHGDVAEQGGQFGFIKFGSRVDVFLPLGTEINVKLGDVVKGGITVLAELKA